MAMNQKNAPVVVNLTDPSMNNPTGNHLRMNSAQRAISPPLNVNQLNALNQMAQMNQMSQIQVNQQLNQQANQQINQQIAHQINQKVTHHQLSQQINMNVQLKGAVGSAGASPLGSLIDCTNI
jgi:hypothetical protein